jgi:hypothetical protein
MHLSPLTDLTGVINRKAPNYNRNKLLYLRPTHLKEQMDMLNFPQEKHPVVITKVN